MSEQPSLYKGVTQAYPLGFATSNARDVPPVIYCPVCGSAAQMVPFEDNIRESGYCGSCSAWNRKRALALVLLRELSALSRKPLTSLADANVPQDVQIYSAENRGPVHTTLMPLAGYVFGEYLGPQHGSGDVVDGVMHQNLMDTSFDDNSFDLVITSDVMEHIPEPYLAHREIYRILKPGGSHIFTVPSIMEMPMDVQHALVTPSGIEYFAPPEYHGEPLDQNLVYNTVGLEMLVVLRGLGYEPFVWHIDDPAMGIIGPGTVVYQARKAYEPSDRPIPQARRARAGAPLGRDAADGSQSLADAGARVGAVVVANGDDLALNACLRSLVDSIDVSKLESIIVVDNGTRSTIDRDIEGVQAISVDQPLPQDAAFITGLQDVASETVLLVTPDILFERRFLDPLVARLRDDNAPASVTPTVMRHQSEDEWAQGVTQGLSGTHGVCLLLRVDSDGGTCEHVPGSTVASTVGVGSQG